MYIESLVPAFVDVSISQPFFRCVRYAFIKDIRCRHTILVGWCTLRSMEFVKILQDELSIEQMACALNSLSRLSILDDPGRG